MLAAQHIVPEDSPFWNRTESSPTEGINEPKSVGGNMAENLVFKVRGDLEQRRQRLEIGALMWRQHFVGELHELRDQQRCFPQDLPGIRMRCLCKRVVHNQRYQGLFVRWYLRPVLVLDY